MNSNGSLFTIKAFNPHEATHPGHKVVSEETLTLIKLLRDQGNQIVVEPDDGRPIEYLFRKGLKEFFTDPVVISFGVAVTSKIVADLVISGVKWIWQHRRKEHIVMSVPKITNILLANTADGSIFSCYGEALDSSALKELLSLASQQREEFRRAANNSKNPYPELRVPIFIEHTATLVGWCDLKYKENGSKAGLFSEHVYIFDKAALKKISSGELRGMSITGIAQESICTVCHSSYIDCNHITGVLYESVLCTNQITRATLVNVNLVAKPINRDCYLQMMSRVNQDK
jgi:hypothetical protein